MNWFKGRRESEKRTNEAMSKSRGLLHEEADLVFEIQAAAERLRNILREMEEDES